MIKLRNVIALLVFLLLSFPLHSLAQAEIQGEILVDDTVGASFEDSVPHIWQFTGEKGQILEVTLMRTSGQFIPELRLLQSGEIELQGETLPDIVDGNRNRQVMIFDSLPQNGVYDFVVSFGNEGFEPSLLAYEYSLTVSVLGQHRIEDDEVLSAIDEFDDITLLFNEDAEPEPPLDVRITGSAELSQPNVIQNRNQYEFKIGDDTVISLNNAIPISRGIRAIAFVDESIALQANQGAIFFTNQRISSLEQDGSVTHIRYGNDKLIQTDFYRIQSIYALDEIVVLYMDTGQRIAFEGNEFVFVRRGGINGEGPNAEPINIFRFGSGQFISDLDGWTALDFVNSQLRIVTDGDFRFYSKPAQIEFMRRGNSNRPDLDVVSINREIFDIKVNDGDRELPITIDPHGIAELAVAENNVRVVDLNTRILSEPLSAVRNVQVVDSQILFLHDDGCSSRYFLDQITLKVGCELVENPSVFANELGYVPRNYNRLGTSIFDYHPQFELSDTYLPVNRVTGNFVYPVEDFFIPSHGLDLEWSRSYNSQALEDLTPAYMRDLGYLMGRMGLQWRHRYQYDLDISNVPIGQLRLILPDGSTHIFRSQSENIYRSTSLLSWTVKRLPEADGIWQAYTTEGLIYEFDELGRLQEIATRAGASIVFSPIPSHILAAENMASGFYVIESYGRRLEVFMDAGGNIVKVLDPQQRQIEYTYNNSGYLIQVDYVAHDEEALYTYRGGVLVKIEDARSPYNPNLGLSYDSRGRVTEYTVNSGRNDSFVTSYAYRDQERLTLEVQTVNGEDRETLWMYNEQFRLTEWALQSPQGAWTTRLEYNPDGYLISIRQPQGAFLRFNIDEYGYLTSFTDPQFSGEGSYRLSYRLDEEIYLYQLTEVVGLQNTVTTLSYDADKPWLLSSLNSPNHLGNPESEDNLKVYSYGKYGRVESIEYLGEETIYTYDEFGYVDSISSPQGNWNIRYDMVGRLLQVEDTQAEGKTTSIIWDDDRNEIIAIIAGGIRYDYDYVSGNLVSYAESVAERDEAGQRLTPYRQENYEYNILNQMTKHTDTSGLVLSYVYDEVGNLLSSGTASSTTTYAYDVVNQLIEKVSPEGKLTTYNTSLAVEGTRKIYRVQNASNEETVYYYDGLGRMRRVSLYDRNGQLIVDYVLTYSALGYLRLIEEVNTLQGRDLVISNTVTGLPTSSSLNGVFAVTRYEYDKYGNLIEHIDPSGNSTLYRYDSGKLETVVLPDNSTQHLSYDGLGRVIAFTDVKGNVYRFSYNGFDQVTEMDAPYGQQTQYQYDGRGNLSLIIDPQGNEQSFIYDDYNRIIEFSDALGNDTEYSYDDLGRLQEISQAGGLTSNIGYNSAGNIGVITQPNDREFLYGYDRSGRITSVTNPLGYSTLYAYDTYGLLGRIVDPLGYESSFVWRNNRRISKYTASNGLIYAYEYDVVGRLSVIDAQGLANDQASDNNLLDMRVSYDRAGYVTEIALAADRAFEGVNAKVYRYEYDSVGRVVSYTDAEEGVWRFEYDELGRLSFKYNPLGGISHYDYDDEARLIQVNHNYHNYDPTLPMDEQVNEPIIESYRYNERGLLVEFIAANETNYQFVYDANDQLVERLISSRGVEQRERYEYDAVGRISLIEDATGLVKDYSYDVFGNLLQLSLQTAESTASYRYQYDELNNLRVMTLPEGQGISMTYNVLSQRVRFIDAENNGWSYSYDNSGNISQISNPLGSIFSFEFDLGNRISNITYPTGAEVQIGYDQSGNLSDVLLPTTRTDDTIKNELIDYDFDLEGRLIGIEHNGQPHLVLSRDALGNVVEMQTGTGDEIVFKYNELGQLTNIIPPADKDVPVSREYDVMGQLSKIVYGDESHTFAYDGFGHLTQMTYTNGDVEHEFVYKYGVSGMLEERNANEYGTIAYIYDDFGRANLLTINGAETVIIAYGANGWRRTVSRSNNSETRYTYDGNGRLTGSIHVGASGERLDGFLYEYDAAGNLTRITRTDNWSVLYSYDSAQQLISERWLNPANELIYSASYSYDAAGNRIEQNIFSEKDGRIRTEFRYNRNNQLKVEIQGTDLPVDTGFIPVIGGLVLSVPLLWWMRRRRNLLPIVLVIPIAIPMLQTQGGFVINYDYDGNGNLISIVNDNNSRSYEYDAFNRLTQIQQLKLSEVPEAEEAYLIDIEYNALGRVAAIHRFDGAGELSSDSDYTASYSMIYDANGLVAIRSVNSETQYFSRLDDEILLMTDSSGDSSWALLDGFGSVRRYINSEAQTIANLDFNSNAFGEIINIGENASGALTAPQQLYLGQLYEPVSGLYLMGARTYDPRLGRFLQRDPLRHDPRGNLYTYAYNQPTAYTDTSGFHPEEALKALRPNIPLREQSALIPEPVDNNFVQAVSVHAQQERENYRVLQVAYITTYEMNDVAFALADDACDLYLHVLNPAPDEFKERSGQAFRAMLDLYDDESGWLASHHPDTDKVIEPMRYLEVVLPLLATASDNMLPLTGCQDSLSLPQLPDPYIGIADDIARQNLAQMVREVPLYTVFAEEMLSLQKLPDAVMPVGLPNLQVDVPSVMITPSLGGQIGSLQSQTGQFFEEIMLPELIQD